MSRTSEPVTNRKFVMVLVNLALVIAVVLGGSAGVSASSTSITRPTVVNVPVVARVVDGNGRAQRAATVIACPYVGAASDCTQAIRQPVGLLGFAVLSLNKATRYSVFAFVKNPSPAWECPGYPIGNDVLYISPESTNGTPQQLPLVSKFTVAKPGPYDCVTVRVTDDAGNPLPGAGVHVDGRPSGSGPADSNGTVRFKATPGVSYDIDAFVTNTGWPCPWVNPTDGTPFHFGEHRTVTAEQLLAGQTVVIHKPTAYECVTVTVTDDAGNPIPEAGLFVNDGYSNGQTDANGTIRIKVTPGTTYEIGAFVAGTGWPCPSWVNPVDGTAVPLGGRVEPSPPRNCIAGRDVRDPPPGSERVCTCSEGRDPNGRRVRCTTCRQRSSGRAGTTPSTPPDVPAWADQHVQRRQRLARTGRRWRDPGPDR